MVHEVTKGARQSFWGLDRRGCVSEGDPAMWTPETEGTQCLIPT
jgi:hypothetical protein